MNIGDWQVTSSSGKFRGWYILCVSSLDNPMHLCIDASYRLTSRKYIYLTPYHQKIIEQTNLNCRTEFKVLLSGLLL
jgi:hypothetical protein